MSLQVPDINVHRVAAIDPGTDTLGFSITDYYLDPGVMRGVVVNVHTVSGKALIANDDLHTTIHGERAARLWALRTYIVGQLELYRPDVLIHESPFLRHNPSTFATLVECCFTIRSAAEIYSPTLKVYHVDPPTAKKSVGVKAKGSTKEDVQRGVIATQDLILPGEINRAEIDEHGWDSLAVGYAYYTQLKGQVCLN